MQAQTLHLERFPLSLLFASPPRWALCSSRGQSLGLVFVPSVQQRESFKHSENMSK